RLGLQWFRTSSRDCLTTPSPISQVSAPRSSCGYFFFQAEDGIRDFHVTGVQTCALPISCELTRTSKCKANSLVNAERNSSEKSRSEERRVGKECRSRWSAYEEKGKQRKTKGRGRQRGTHRRSRKIGTQEM